jgi:hypothetical protein
METELGDTLEIKYFNKIQIQKLEIRSLKIQIGKLESEIDHLNYLLEKSIEPPSKKAKQLKRNYDSLLYKHTKLLQEVKQEKI